MSGGGSSTPAPAPSTTTQIQDIPEWEQGYVTSLLGQAQSVAAQPYQQFPGQQVADFTPDQLQAFSGVENAPSAYAPLQASAANSATAGGNSASNIYGAGSPLLAAGAGAATPGGINAYMSPYLNSAVQGTINAANQNWNENIMPGVNNEFVGSGQFGSGRNAQVLGQAANQEQTNLTGQVANLENTGYSQASTNAQNEAGNLINAGNSLGNLEATQAGQQNANAATTGNLAAQTAGTNLTQDQALQAVGQEQQGQNQTNINTAEQNWQNQVNYPAQQTEYLNQIIRGLPASSATTTASQTTPLGVYSPSPLSGVGGSTAALAALAGGTGGTSTPNTGQIAKRGGLIKGHKKGGRITGYASGGLIDDAGNDPTDNPLDLSALNGDIELHDPYSSGADSSASSAADMPSSDGPPAPLAAAPSMRPTASATPPNYASTSGVQGKSLDGESANPINASSLNTNGGFKPISDSDMQKYQLLALARGMLSPTRTGSPWESLGNSIGGVADTELQQQQYNQKQQQLAFEKNLELNKLGLQKEQIEQGRYTPVKDFYGNVTGMVEGKSGKFTPVGNTQNAQGSGNSNPANDEPSADPQKAALQIMAEQGTTPTPVMSRQDITGRNKQVEAYNNAALAAKSTLQQLNVLDAQTGKYTPGSAASKWYGLQSAVDEGGEGATARTEADKASKALANSFMQANVGNKGSGIRMVQFDAGAVPNADMTDDARTALIEKNRAIANSQIQRAQISNLYPHMNIANVNAIMDNYESKNPPLLPDGSANKGWMSYQSWLKAGRPDTTTLAASSGEGHSSQGSGASQALSAPPAKREIGQSYPTPKGPMTWTGKGWVPTAGVQ